MVIKQSFEIHKYEFSSIYQIINNHTMLRYHLCKLNNPQLKNTLLNINSITLNKMYNIPFYDYYFVHHYSNYYFNSFVPCQLRRQYEKKQLENIEMTCYFDIINENYEYYGYIKQTNEIKFYQER